MRLSSSIASAAKLATLTLTILAALTVLNTNTVYASPIIASKNPETNAQVGPHLHARALADTSKNVFVASSAHASAEAAPQEHQENPRVLIGPHGPLLYRRGEFGKTNPSAVERPPNEGGEVTAGERHTKRADENQASGGGDENKKRPIWHYKRADENQASGGGDENKRRPIWHYRRADEHQGGGDENRPSGWHFKRADEHQAGGDENKKPKPVWHYGKRNVDAESLALVDGVSV
ncbi:hypothetical protein BGW39_000285 [Mortierella sp. 14UC]|nr:hypothetical protein BGW39_000285 [Mortierella sp. 14UC]